MLVEGSIIFHFTRGDHSNNNVLRAATGILTSYKTDVDVAYCLHSKVNHNGYFATFPG